MEPFTTTLTSVVGKLAGTTVSTATTEKIGSLIVSRLGFKALMEADPEVVHPLSLSLSVLRGVNAAETALSTPSFGGLAKVERLCDLQKGPTCWREAIENIIQLMKGDVSGSMNNLSDKIYGMVKDCPRKFDAVLEKDPNAGEVFAIPRYSYPVLLKEFGIRAKSVPFSHKTLQIALQENRPVMISGKAKFLYSDISDEDCHVVVAVDYNPATNEYTILDSNKPQPCLASSGMLQQFARGVDGNQMCMTLDSARKWPHSVYHFGVHKVELPLKVETSELKPDVEVAKALSTQKNSVAFGASLPVLQLSAELSNIANKFGPSTIPGVLLNKISNSLSGTNGVGMETIRDAVKDAAKFYGLKTPNIFYEKGQPGVMWEGLSDASYDDWVGGDPKTLAAFANTYGGDFAKAVMGHEIGHHVFDKLGFREAFEKTFGLQYGRICNEAAADYLSGLYCGSLGLDGRGFAEFLANDTSYLSGYYPKGSVRSALFKEGYATANSYPWKRFQSILRDSSFSLRDKVVEVVSRQIPIATQTLTDTGVMMSSVADLSAKKGVDDELQGCTMTVNTESVSMNKEQGENEAEEWAEKLRAMSQLESQTVEKLSEEVAAIDAKEGIGQVSFGGSCNGCSGSCHGSCSGSCAGSCDASKTGRDCYYK